MEVKIKWYFKTPTLVIAFLCVGPFMLPLVWLHPSYNTKKKVIISTVIAVLSYLMWLVFTFSLKSIFAYYGQMFQQF